MKAYQQAFIDFAISQDVLKFGEFTLKSGRISPYFFNAGLFQTGSALAKLSKFYAQAIMESEIQFDMLFGPAYKGIPLVSTIAMALYQDYDMDLPYAFNRKEAKTHGEGGNIVGAPLTGRVLVVDDVMTAGTAIREAADIVNNNGATLAGVAISLDRQEKGTGEQSAVQEVESDYAIKVASIVSLSDVTQHIEHHIKDEQLHKKISLYRQTYGI